MTQKKIRIGVVGTRFGADVHVPAFRRIPGCEVRGLCGRSGVKTRRLARRLGVPRAYADWRRLVRDDGIDAVSVAVPSALQPKIVRAALEHGKPVFCEKPLALSVREAVRLERLARQKGLATAVDFEFPENPAWQKAREWIAAGRLGRLRHVTLVWQVETYANRMKLSSWKTDPSRGGGVVHNFFSHALYNIEWLAGPVRRLTATSFRAPDLTTAARGCHTITASLELVRGVSAALVVGTASFAGSGHRLEIYGEKGSLFLTNAGGDYLKGFRLWWAARPAGRLRRIRTVSVRGADGRIPAVAGLAGRFVRAVRRGRWMTPSFREGLRVQHLIAKTLESDRRGRQVRAGS